MECQHKNIEMTIEEFTRWNSDSEIVIVIYCKDCNSYIE